MQTEREQIQQMQTELNQQRDQQEQKKQEMKEKEDSYRRNLDRIQRLQQDMRAQQQSLDFERNQLEEMRRQRDPRQPPPSGRGINIQQSPSGVVRSTRAGIRRRQQQQARTGRRPTGVGARAATETTAPTGTTGARGTTGAAGAAGTSGTTTRTAAPPGGPPDGGDDDDDNDNIGDDDDMEGMDDNANNARPRRRGRRRPGNGGPGNGGPGDGDGDNGNNQNNQNNVQPPQGGIGQLTNVLTTLIQRITPETGASEIEKQIQKKQFELRMKVDITKFRGEGNGIEKKLLRFVEQAMQWMVDSKLLDGPTPHQDLAVKYIATYGLAGKARQYYEDYISSSGEFISTDDFFSWLLRLYPFKGILKECHEKLHNIKVPEGTRWEVLLQPYYNAKKMYELAIENTVIERIQKYEMTPKGHANLAEKSLPPSILERYDNYIMMRDYLIENIIDVQRTLDELREIEEQRDYGRTNPYESSSNDKTKLGSHVNAFQQQRRNPSRRRRRGGKNKPRGGRNYNQRSYRYYRGYKRSGRKYYYKNQRGNRGGGRGYRGNNRGNRGRGNQGNYRGQSRGSGSYRGGRGRYRGNRGRGSYRGRNSTRGRGRSTYNGNSYQRNNYSRNNYSNYNSYQRNNGNGKRNSNGNYNNRNNPTRPDDGTVEVTENSLQNILSKYYYNGECRKCNMHGHIERNCDYLNQYSQNIKGMLANRNGAYSNVNFITGRVNNNDNNNNNQNQVNNNNNNNNPQSSNNSNNSNSNTNDNSNDNTNDSNVNAVQSSQRPRSRSASSRTFLLNRLLGNGSNRS